MRRDRESIKFPNCVLFFVFSMKAFNAIKEEKDNKKCKINE